MGAFEKAPCTPKTFRKDIKYAFYYKTGIRNGLVFDDIISHNDNYIIWDNGDDSFDNGLLVTLYFKAKD